VDVEYPYQSERRQIYSIYIILQIKFIIIEFRPLTYLNSM